MVKIIYWYEHRSKRKKMILKKFLTLMNNAVYGKTMENVRKHGDNKVATKKEEEATWWQKEVILQSFS